MCQHMCPVIGGEAATRRDIKGKGSGLEVFAQSGCRAPIAMNTSVHWSNDRVLRLFQDNQCLWNCQQSIIKIVFVKLTRGTA
jgi:hypothetical protein